ncbi:U3 small nucleolar ribonucleoprotein LCP5 [Geosmithia morbida]|uniref:U3 small nucleolar ribonucleoprotein LCP5 n=1 Tax=Geosmithia morbida TaxID=1094350 RepID=A0A9P4Z2D7_9HYPO|nr:U3 small nucleolar ribonucleoprotein LCP5 [Geosmithia morbida]KAF4126912.1 U3 small nucleolar ribonucleoprotein LCP5 [Geosmithia morbida]
MAAPASLSALLDSLTQSLASAQDITPQIASIGHQKQGISLLDVKNELLLSYLQNLVFLILLKLRNSKGDDNGKTDDGDRIDEAVRTKLVELRLYLEKGARPLEEKLRYSIESFLTRARESQSKDEVGKKGKKTKSSRTGSESDESESDSESEDESEEEDDDADNSDIEGSVVDGPPKPKKIPSGGKRSTGAPALAGLAEDKSVRPTRGVSDAPDGVYRPPKRERHVMDKPASQREKRNEGRAAHSRTMDEFVASELSAAPQAEPSIGTTIVQGGRKVKTSFDREKEAERQSYEESNFVRLPKENKKDRARKNREAAARSSMSFGGEEWHDLGEGVSRIDRLTRRKDGGGRASNVRSMLDKSRKRGAADAPDGPRGSGDVMGGERFQKRVRLEEAGRRDRGKKR